MGSYLLDDIDDFDVLARTPEQRRTEDPFAAPGESLQYILRTNAPQWWQDLARSGTFRGHSHGPVWPPIGDVLPSGRLLRAAAAGLLLCPSCPHCGDGVHDLVSFDDWSEWFGSSIPRFRTSRTTLLVPCGHRMPVDAELTWRITIGPEPEHVVLTFDERTPR